MKIVGAMTIVVVSYLFGRMKRGSALLGERILDQIIRLFKEIRSSIEYGAGSLVNTIAESAYKETYDKLGFLKKAAAEQDTDLYLGEVLCHAFDNWENISSFSKDERSVIKGVFDGIGSESGSAETAKLDFALERLGESLDTRRSANKKHKGYYETIFTLAGIAVAILLI